MWVRSQLAGSVQRIRISQGTGDHMAKMAMPREVA